MSEAALLRMDDYTTQAKAYWWATAVLGVAALAFAVTRVAALRNRRDPPGAARHAVRRDHRFVSPSAFRVQRLRPGSGDLRFPAASRLRARCGGHRGGRRSRRISWRTSVRWTSRIGSPAMAALAMSACGTAFSFAQAHLPIDASSAGAKFALLLALSVAYFAAGTLLMASLITLKRGEPILP